MNIKIEIKDFKRLIEQTGKAQQSVYPLTRSALNKSAMSIKYSAKDKSPVAFGDLKQSINHNVDGLTAKVWAEQPYAVFVEEGTRPHYPPIAPLQRWAKLKLGSSALGYAVQKKIGREGTEAQPFFKPAVNENIKNIEKNFTNLADQLIRIMAS